MINDPTDPYGGEYPPPPAGDPDDPQPAMGWWQVIGGAWRWVTDPTR